MKRFFQSIDNFCLRLERKLGLGLTSILFGLILLGLAALFTSPRWELFYHGKGFSRLSLAPFDFSIESSLRYRILSPLLGYILFLKGEQFKYLMLGFLALFHCLVYFFHRIKAFSPSESLGIGMLLSLSTLSFYQLYFPGYNDPVSYVLVLILLFKRNNKFIVQLCLVLLLFNHDNTIFLFPFLFLYLLEEDYSFSNILKCLKLFFPGVILYIMYRVIISSFVEVGFNTSYYFDQQNLRWTWDHVLDHLHEGIFQAFRVAWILPIIAIIVNAREGKYKEIILLTLGFIFIISQFLIAYDISRLTGLAFPLILVSSWRIREYYGSNISNSLIWLIILVNLFVPSLCIGALEPLPYPPFWWPGLKEWIYTL